ncbi:Glycosyltransferase involved in cell wall bisynthesis [Xylanibacter ruminicola]|uniref:Glycosyltransferase involved in cell wall bisynthesis n=1 Tax=Xylanibacter ruminicola TaxID=839 RepID=A0A1H4DRJ9_XYLRU|nr:hypothetical protein [Xylanibacter ruminicola]SEA75374.1 Glycosyltransferase involved in cell wall bisynthesis [Xylanibacter ruminicola]
MKILLIGEYSGLFTCLSDGLRFLGHQVFTASNGDGTRDYPADFRWDKHFQLPKINGLLEILYILQHRKLFCGYDVVMFISTRALLYAHFEGFNYWFYKYVKKNNKKVFISDSGLDFISFQYWNSHKETKYHDYTEAYLDNPQHDSFLMDKNAATTEAKIREMVDGTIPLWYEYAQPHRQFKSLKPTIRIPINIDKFEYKPNKVGEKIVFFHGISRACKGGKYIQAAFDRLRNKYSDVAEFICAGGLPFEEYMELTNRTNVILDDVHSYSFSMNALFAMARGKIYMGGAESEGNKELGYEDCPVMNLTKDVDQICSAIEYVIANRDKIEEWGLKSRKFVEKYHSYKDIAQQYIDCWTNT